MRYADCPSTDSAAPYQPSRRRSPKSSGAQPNHPEQVSRSLTRAAVAAIYRGHVLTRRLKAVAACSWRSSVPDQPSENEAREFAAAFRGFLDWVHSTAGREGNEVS